jgi:hypothetical protein
MSVDPLTVACPTCRYGIGERCVTSSGWPCSAHQPRRRLALAVAAHADPALDAWPQLGPVSPCGICGCPELPQRHRMVDAIAERMAAGELPEDMADDYRLPLDAVRTVQAWAARWPGAWR